MATRRSLLFRKCLLVAGLASVSGSAAAAAPEPSGAHPRLWLDAPRRAALKESAKDPQSATARVVRQCAKLAGTLKEEAKNLYMGLDWAAHATNCALAWHATGDAAHAKTALHFWNAMLDDWEFVGDGKGGDNAARNDHGYAIRAIGVHSAIVYDWLHDAPGMTPALLAKARKRFQAWTDWYYSENGGYRFKDAGTNYHAGYLLAVTATAIAQGGEAGAAGGKLWRHVVDQVWGKDMRAELGPGALLDGGDWGEGWQYAPLAVASYSLAAKAISDAGVPQPEMARWAEQVVTRHVHALTPNGKGIFVAGDTQNEKPNLAPEPWTLYGVIAGPSTDTVAGWARAETERLQLKSSDKSFMLFEVLAEARKVKPVPFPRQTTPTFYRAKGIGTFYARSSWAPDGVWLAMQCTKKIEVDHLPPNAGNFVLTRGNDDLIVDPSPYGSLSTVTSNAPTVDNGQFPAEYKPSQGFWGENTRYDWAFQTASAVVLARCDYSDAYRFQSNPSDVPLAVRDIVLVPSKSGGDATAIVVDRARTGADSRALHLRFRTTANDLALDPSGAAKGRSGASTLTIRPLFQSAGKPETKATPPGDCFKDNVPRGGCKAARFPVVDYATTLKGAQALAIHAIDVAGASAVATTRVTQVPGYRVVAIERGAERATVVVADAAAQPKLAYKAPAGSHVVLDAPASAAGQANVTAVSKDGQCEVTVAPADSGGLAARPLAFVLDERCEAKLDAPQAGPREGTPGAAPPSSVPGPGAAAATPGATPAASASGPRVGSRGCGGCATTPADRGTLAPGVVGAAVAMLVARRRRGLRRPSL